MRVLFIVIPERGHLNPYIGPAQELAGRGHEVAFWAPADVSPQLAEAGLERFLGPPVREPPVGLSKGQRFAEQVRDPAWLRAWIHSLLIEGAPPMIDPIEAVLAEFEPHVVATDPMLYAAAIACNRRKVRWASLSNSLNPVLPNGLDSALLRTVAALATDREALFASHDMRVNFRGCDMLSPFLTVAFTTSALVPDPPLGVELVGPSWPRGRRGDEPAADGLLEQIEDDRPLVYMSLGSQIYYQPRMFRVVMDAVADRPVRLLASVAELHGSRALDPVPGNVTTARYLPQIAVLERARVMISHGGANSFMEATRAGVPLLLSPICNDQFHQAHFLEQAQMGLVLDLQTATPAQVWEGLEALLSDGRARKRTAEIAASYATSGAARCADLLEFLNARNRR